MGKVEYSSTNSGGSWWLTDDDWFNLEKAGWKIDWYKDKVDGLFMKADEDRFLGALASGATREGLSLKMAMAEWEDITHQSPYEEGCRCCGEPHSFYEIDDQGNYIW